MMNAVLESNDAVDINLGDIFSPATQNYQNATHCFIWAPSTYKVFGKYETKAVVLMQLRFDGVFGFPGGLVDESIQTPQDIVDALNRELVEEMNLNLDKFKVTCDNYMFSHKQDSLKLFCHFYSLQVSLQDIKEIEKDALSAADYGDETLGHVRVPLYVMDDGVKGFPSFLANNFIGIAKIQLLKAIKCLNILTYEELHCYLIQYRLTL